MARYIIKWNCGYGDNAETVDADNQDHADKLAYERWREDAETNADYSAAPWTKDEAENYGLDDSDEE